MTFELFWCLLRVMRQFLSLPQMSTRLLFSSSPEISCRCDWITFSKFTTWQLCASVWFSMLPAPCVCTSHRDSQGLVSTGILFETVNIPSDWSDNRTRSRTLPARLRRHAVYIRRRSRLLNAPYMFSASLAHTVVSPYHYMKQLLHIYNICLKFKTISKQCSLSYWIPVSQYIPHTLQIDWLSRV